MINLKQILEDHLLWLSSNKTKGKQADLSNQDLSGTNLYRVNLAYANLAYANLANANLAYANLANANLYNAYLTSTNLENTNLENTNLENVKGVQVFKCFYVENNEKKIQYFLHSIEAKKEMSKRLANRQCSWVE